MATKKTAKAAAAATTSDILSIPPFNQPALAATEQLFGSGKVAVKAGQYVVLEFGYGQITVHDPFIKSPSEINKLGVILYSYGFSKWDKELSMDKAAATGQVSKDMFFYFLRIDHSKEQSECRVCGRVWLYPPKTHKDKREEIVRTTEAHLAEHYSTAPKK